MPSVELDASLVARMVVTFGSLEGSVHDQSCPRETRPWRRNATFHAFVTVDSSEE